MLLKNYCVQIYGFYSIHISSKAFFYGNLDIKKAISIKVVGNEYIHNQLYSLSLSYIL